MIDTEMERAFSNEIGGVVAARDTDVDPAAAVQKQIDALCAETGAIVINALQNIQARADQARHLTEVLNTLRQAK